MVEFNLLAADNSKTVSHGSENKKQKQCQGVLTRSKGLVSLRTICYSIPPDPKCCEKRL